MLIGIDGGGTKTEFVLCNQNGSILHKLKLSRSNPNDIGIECCCKIIAEGIDRLLQIEPTVCSVFAGIAGCATGDNGEQLEAFLKKRYPSITIGVATDGMNVLSCNVESTDTVALICGTGSVLLARECGKIHRIGGWGYLFDGAGSAYDIGRDAIAATLAQLDGMGETTLLTELLEERLGENVWDALQPIYQKGKAYIASLAPLVFTAYGREDQVAARILHQNAERLALLISAAKVQYRFGRQVVMYGGVIEHWGNVLLPMVNEALSFDMELVLSDVPPVFGACVESCRLMKQNPGQAFKKNFQETYDEKNRN